MAIDLKFPTRPNTAQRARLNCPRVNEISVVSVIMCGKWKERIQTKLKCDDIDN